MSWNIWNWDCGKPGTPQPPEKRVSVVEQIAEVIKTGKIIYESIGRYQISELRWKFKEEELRISWFSSGNVDEFRIGYESFPGLSKDLDYLVKLAVQRAEGLFDEKMKELENKA